jgi:arabinose-5-phosphate isomerase
MTMIDTKQVLEETRELIHAEAAAMTVVADALGDAFVETVRMVGECQGKVLVTGAGTSGTIGRRLAHLLSCCGTPSFFVHPADALHGSSAAVTPGDVVIALSKAGASAELNQFVTVARQRGGKVISWTSNPDSELARRSDIVVFTPNDPQAEGEGVYPFGSSLSQAAVGDALCLLTRRMRGFALEDLLQTHPSGATARLVEKRGTSA